MGACNRKVGMDPPDAPIEYQPKESTIKPPTEYTEETTKEPIITSSHESVRKCNHCRSDILSTKELKESESIYHGQFEENDCAICLSCISNYICKIILQLDYFSGKPITCPNGSCAHIYNDDELRKILSSSMYNMYSKLKTHTVLQYFGEDGDY